MSKKQIKKMRESIHETHRRRYGYNLPEESVDKIIAMRLYVNYNVPIPDGLITDYVVREFIREEKKYTRNQTDRNNLLKAYGF